MIPEPEFDLLDPRLHADGGVFDIFRRLQREAPVAWQPGRRSVGGFWAVTRHADVVRVCADPATFSSAEGTRPESRRPEGAVRTLNTLDPPDHGALRRLLSPGLAPRSLEQLEARLGSLARRLVRRIEARAGADSISDLAAPLSLAALSAWLGLPPLCTPSLGRLVARSHLAGAALLDCSPGTAGFDQRRREAAAAKQALYGWLERRIAESESGALGLLRDASATGRLAPREAIALATLLVEAGHTTAQDALGSAASLLLETPGQRARLAAAPALMPVAIEELLRLASPVVQFARRVTRETALGGVTLAPGQQVVVFFAAANRDDAVFASPDSLELGRSPNPHLAFGAGTHRCPGAALARLELRAALGPLLPLLGRATPAGEAPRRRSNFTRGLLRLPVELGPSPSSPRPGP